MDFNVNYETRIRALNIIKNVMTTEQKEKYNKILAPLYEVRSYEGYHEGMSDFLVQLYKELDTTRIENEDDYEIVKFFLNYFCDNLSDAFEPCCISCCKPIPCYADVQYDCTDGEIDYSEMLLCLYDKIPFIKEHVQVFEHSVCKECSKDFKECSLCQVPFDMKLMENSYCLHCYNLVASKELLSKKMDDYLVKAILDYMPYYFLQNY